MLALGKPAGATLSGIGTLSREFDNTLKERRHGPSKSHRQPVPGYAGRQRSRPGCETAEYLCLIWHYAMAPKQVVIDELETFMTKVLPELEIADYETPVAAE